MTSQDNRRQRRLDDERSVDALLAESGFQEDADLRDMLLQLRALRTLDVPPPSAGLAALMDEDAFPVEGVRPLAPSVRKRNRAVFTSLAVAASLGIAGGAAAGNETLRRGAEGTISSIIGSLLAPAPPEPPPALPSEAPGTGAAVVPAPAATPPPESLPAGFVPGAGPGQVQHDGSPARAPETTPTHPIPADPPGSSSGPPAVPPEPGTNRSEVPGRQPVDARPESTAKHEEEPPAAKEAPAGNGGAAAGRPNPGKPGPASQPPELPRNPDPAR